MLRGGRENQPSAEYLDGMHLLDRILSQEHSESNGHLSRNLSKFGASRTSGTCGGHEVGVGWGARAKARNVEGVWAANALRRLLCELWDANLMAQ